MKILIVDDERHSRETLLGMVTVSGFEDVLTAEDGIEALEMIGQSRPELVIADIRMPGLDGIGLLSRAKEIDEDIVFVFVSGYDLFEYAQKALQHGAFSYLLKPVAEAELLAVIENVVSALHLRRWQRDSHSQYRIKAAQGDELLRKQFLLELLSGESAEEGYIGRKLSELNIRFDLELFLVLIVSIDDYAKPGPIQRNAVLYKFGVENIASETLRNGEIRSFAFPYEDGQGFLLHYSGFSRLTHPEGVLELCRGIQRNIADYLKFTVTIGVGEEVSDVGRLADSYQGAVKAVKQRLAKGNGRIFRVDGTEASADNAARSGTIDFRTEQIMLGHFERRDQAALFQLVADLYSGFGRDEIADIEELMKLNFQLVLSLYKIMDQLGANAELRFGDELSLYQEANGLTGIETIVAWFQRKVEACFELMEEVRDRGNKRFMDMAKEYIRSRYDQDLTLEAVAKHVNLSPGYFSKQFKQEFGENFVDYLIHFRIDKSKELLKAGTHSVKEIAARVGYHDEKYFYKVFKKMTGLTPKEYYKR